MILFIIIISTLIMASPASFRISKVINTTPWVGKIKLTYTSDDGRVFSSESLAEYQLLNTQYVADVSHASMVIILKALAKTNKNKCKSYQIGFR